MAGITNDILSADNVNFTGSDSTVGTVTTDGELLIGSTATPNIKVGTLKSPNSTISIGYSSPDITLDLAGGTEAIDSIAVQAGTSPVLPTAAGLVTINGSTVAAGTNPVRTDGTGPNTMAVEVQISQAIASTDATKIGLSNFNNSHFSVDENGFVSLIGGSLAIDSIGVNNSSGTGTNPVLPNGTGQINFTGGQVANSGFGNVINITSANANQVTAQIQRAGSSASANTTKNGVCHFISSQFSIDSDGLVSTNGAGIGSTITGDTGGALSPTAGNWNILGSSVASGSTPVSTSGLLSTLTVNVQTAQAIASTNANSIGLASFDSSSFDVDANGFVELQSSALGVLSVSGTPDRITSTGGQNPVIDIASNYVGQTSLTTLGTITTGVWNGSTISEAYGGTNQTTYATGDILYASASNTLSKLAAGSDTQVLTLASGVPSWATPTIGTVTSVGVQANDAPGTNPVLPDGGGLITVNGAAVANHSVVLETRSRAANTYNVEIQYAASSAATDETKSGVAHFDSSDFSVDANGFVSVLGTAGFQWSDVSGAFSPLSQNGYFVTGTSTGTLPASPSNGDTIQFFVDHSSQKLTIQASGTQIIRLATQVSSAGGTIQNTQRGDSLELVYRATNNCWCAVSGFNGGWNFT